MTGARVYTADEVREMFLDHLRVVAKYWTTEGPATLTLQDRVEGAIFSTLTAIDGSAASLPSFALVVRPHQEDKSYHQNNNENWFPEPDYKALDAMCDIAGSLHDNFYKK